MFCKKRVRNFPPPKLKKKETGFAQWTFERCMKGLLNFVLIKDNAFFIQRQKCFSEPIRHCRLANFDQFHLKCPLDDISIVITLVEYETPGAPSVDKILYWKAFYRRFIVVLDYC